MARILSVEDDPDFQHIISQALRYQGWEVHYAFTGQEGYDKAVSLNPDVILMDMMLPVFNGVELAKKLKARKSTKAIPIIVMTAYPADANFFESVLKSIGVVEYIRKPVQVKEVVSLIKRVLAGNSDRPPPVVWRRGSVRLAPESRDVWIEDKLVANLSPRRFEVLFLLMQQKGEVSRESLLRKIWGVSGKKNDLEKAIQRLRQDLGSEAYRLRTTRNGYEWVV
jgi:DNA-binding response OmpR family regulator